MTRAAKIRLIITVTVLMSMEAAVLRYSPGRIALGFIWIFHVLYFMLGVKTIKKCYLGGGGGMTVVSSADRIFQEYGSYPNLMMRRPADY